MDQAGAFTLFLLVPIVLSIVALVQLSHLRVTVTELLAKLRKLEGRDEEAVAEPTPKPPAVPPPLPSYVTAPTTSAAVAAVADRGAIPATVSSKKPASELSFNLESLLGVKLFAWIGGLALFLGVVFFVKYAFENNWITPAMRVVAGAIVGVVLIVVSLLKPLRRYRIPAQSLCATGILILYADIYAAEAFYHLIPLTAAMALMWIVTAIALLLAIKIDALTVAWLAVVGGFLTPFLVRVRYDSPILLFGYVAVLSCGTAIVAVLKRWNHLILFAAIGAVIVEFSWAAAFFGPNDVEQQRVIFLLVQALFLGIAIALARTSLSDNWSIAASAIAGAAPILAFIHHQNLSTIILARDSEFATLLLSAAGLIALAIANRPLEERSKTPAVIVAIALGLTWIAEWSWYVDKFLPHGLDDRALLYSPRDADIARNFAVVLQVAIFFLFARTPFFFDRKRVWPWIISALAGPPQFFLVHALLKRDFYPNWFWVIPIAFALPYVAGAWYLVRKQNVELASGDSRLTAQVAAVVTFVSFVFPVQFHREWITLGWAIEGLALILLFRWIPNRRLRLFALIVLLAAFVRLALNPAVLHYHPRTHVPIWNWYLYAYGISALCFFFSARWFGQLRQSSRAGPRDREFERLAPPFLYSLSGIVLFLLMNIEIADYFSIGPTLTFSFSGNFARDMTYTIAWSLFAFALLILGIARVTRPVRLVGIGLLLFSFAKLFLHDLDRLNQLYRIGAFITVAIIAIAASFLYQRFLSPATRNQSQ